MSEYKASDYLIVGRVRRAHGIRGELVVEFLTDDPHDVFTKGRRLLVGDTKGDLPADPAAHEVQHATPFKGGMIVLLDQIPDRSAAERWRDRYLFARRDELTPPDEDQLYLHELIGMRVVLEDGADVGTVEEFYELPQGIVIELQRSDREGTVMVPYIEEIVTGVDGDARVITIAPPDGLLD
ncbi:MAG: ribosome maturation factor RimM [Gemmatimonadaceae bacterium]